MDPTTVIGTGLAVLGSKDLMGKILGPTADYLGAEMKGLIHKCNVNLDTIFSKAIDKLEGRADELGAVNARVLKNIIDEGRFCEDEITAEYFAGVVASSKTVDGRDDRGIPILAKIKQMSSYQIRFHYLTYYLTASFYYRGQLNIGVHGDRLKMPIYIPNVVIEAALGTTDSRMMRDLVPHCASGLYGLGLLNYCHYGHTDDLREEYVGATDPGVIIEPNLRGAELFMWAHGIKGATGHEILKLKDLKQLTEIIIVPGSVAIKDELRSRMIGAARKAEG